MMLCGLVRQYVLTLRGKMLSYYCLGMETAPKSYTPTRRYTPAHRNSDYLAQRFQLTRTNYLYISSVTNL